MINYNKYYKRFHPLEDEKILMVIHESLIRYIPRMIIGVVLFLIPFFLMFNLFTQGVIGISIFCGLLFLAFFYIFREFFLWSRKVLLITSKRVIDFDQGGLFSRTVSEVSHQKIIDISYGSHGAWQSVFRVGAITLKTSIDGLTVIFDNIAQISKNCALVSEIVGKPYKEVEVKLNTEQKLENIEELMQDEDPQLEAVSLKDLVNQYIAIYSKNRLKKMLQDEIERNEKVQD